MLNNLAAMETKEVHVLHRELLPRWWKSAPGGMHEHPEMRASERAMTEDLIALGELFIYRVVEVWEGGPPGLNDQPQVIQTPLLSKIAEVSGPIGTDDIHPPLVPDVLELTVNDLLMAHLDFMIRFSHRVRSFLCILLFCPQIVSCHPLETRISASRDFHHEEEAHVHSQLSRLDGGCAMMGEQR